MILQKNIDKILWSYVIDNKYNIDFKLSPCAGRTTPEGYKFKRYEIAYIKTENAAKNCEYEKQCRSAIISTFLVLTGLYYQKCLKAELAGRNPAEALYKKCYVQALQRIERKNKVIFRLKCVWIDYKDQEIDWKTLTTTKDNYLVRHWLNIPETENNNGT